MKEQLEASRHLGGSPRELFPIEEIPELVPVDPSFIRKLIASGELRSVKVGRRRLVPRAALIEWLDALDRHVA
jgi:excisionase family DNA binding protein